MNLSTAIGHVKMSKEELVLNVQLASNFLASLLKKNWQNIKVCGSHETVAAALDGVLSCLITLNVEHSQSDQGASLVSALVPSRFLLLRCCTSRARWAHVSRSTSKWDVGQ
jgi:hypothetical protein